MNISNENRESNEDWAGETALCGGKNGGGQQRRIAELEKEIEGRDQVIGELTIANRILKKLSGESR